jgi:hypothetical protein
MPHTTISGAAGSTSITELNFLLTQTTVAFRLNRHYMYI